MTQTNFKNLGLSQESLDAVADMGFENPTKIQQDTIPHILEGRDVIGHSQTGTGKTMAFGLPAIDMVDQESSETQVLILCPTRELALQVVGEIRKASVYKPGLEVAAVYGGASMPEQIRKLRDGVQIVVGTPGRVMDHMRRKTLRLNNLKLLVLDEADEMLNMGFRDDIETVLKDVPEGASLVLFSATMSNGIMKITKNYQTNAKVVKSTEKTMTVATVDQWHVSLKKPDKINAVDVLLKYHSPKLTLIFCNTKLMVDNLVTKLQQKSISAVALHGDLNQNARNRVMNGFRTGAMPVLVATDVAARGIDVDDVEMVINYDIPQNEEYYVHRIGRTGRAGREGLAVTFICGRSEQARLQTIERFAKVRIPKKHLPSQSEIANLLNDAFIEKFSVEMEKPTGDEFFLMLDNLKACGHSERKIASTLLRMSLESNAVKVPVTIDKESKNSGAKEANMLRFFINVGCKDKVSASDIVGCVAGESGIASSSIGKVDIYEMYSFVEVEQRFKQQVLNGINNKGVRIRNRNISIDVAKAKTRFSLKNDRK